MKTKIALTALALTGSLTASMTHAAPSRQEQIRERFTETMVKPCEGKKPGDTVTITDRRGGKHQAICTLTAVPMAQ